MQKLCFIQLRLFRQILYSCQNVVVEEVIADIVGRTLFQPLSVLAASVMAVRLAVLSVRPKAHRPSAVCTLHQTGEDLRGSVLLLSAAAGDLFLHLFKDFPRNNGFVGILHSEPFFLRLAYLFLVLVGDIGLLVVYAVADISLIF